MREASFENLLDLKQLLAQGRVWFGEEEEARLIEPGRKRSVNRSLRAKFGIEEIDSKLPDEGLAFGAIHEWCTGDETLGGKNWYPPFLIFSQLFRNAFAQRGKLIETECGDPSALLRRQFIVWVGARCRPAPPLLEGLAHSASWDWHKHTLIVTPQTKDERLWTIVQLLRSPVVFAVVADGIGFNLLATRRFQRAAQAGGALGLLVRPQQELPELTAAQTKWCVRPFRERGAFSSEKKKSKKGRQTIQWSLELARARGIASPLTWLIEWDNERATETDPLHLLPAVVDRHTAAGAEEEGIAGRRIS